MVQYIFTACVIKEYFKQSTYKTIYFIIILSQFTIWGLSKSMFQLGYEVLIGY